ncbi:MAG TPA: glycosyltransferase family 2 protein [Bacteroidia bacterium]|nr:glycosyltransferase family 2 protein [Bacteroidia bacterium]
MARISIITVTYNSAQTLEQTIQSVLLQDHEDVEYIVVDGRSSDDTLSVIRNYRHKIDHFISEKDDGLYHALNKGIALATGDIIGILHADDFYISDDVLTAVAETFKMNDADAVYADLYYVDKDNTDKIVRKWRSGNYTPGKFLWGWMPPHPAFFVKKEMYNRYGVFNTSLRSAADYELMLRLIHKHKIKLAYLPQYIVKMRTGGQSNASIANRVKANKEDRKAWELNGLKPYFFTLTLKPLRKIFQFL